MQQIYRRTPTPKRDLRSNTYGNSSTKKKTIEVKDWYKVQILDKEQRMKWLHAMKQIPLYPSYENVYICNLPFSDDCFEWDLNVRSGVVNGGVGRGVGSGIALPPPPSHKPSPSMVKHWKGPLFWVLNTEIFYFYG